MKTLRECIDFINEASTEEVHQYASKFIPQRLPNICVPYHFDKNSTRINQIDDSGFSIVTSYSSLDELVQVLDNLKKVNLADYPFMDGFHNGLIEISEVNLTPESCETEQNSSIQFWSTSQIIAKELQNMQAHEQGEFVVYFDFEQNETKMDTVVNDRNPNALEVQATLVMHTGQSKQVPVEYYIHDDVIHFLNKEFRDEQGNGQYTTDFIDKFYLTLPQRNSIH